MSTGIVTAHDKMVLIGKVALTRYRYSLNQDLRRGYAKLMATSGYAGEYLALDPSPGSLGNWVPIVCVPKNLRQVKCLKVLFPATLVTTYDRSLIARLVAHLRK